MKIHWLALYLLLGPACGVMARTSATTADAASGETSRARSGDIGLDWDGMDSGVAPGDDFYAHANGDWLRNTPIPADRAFHGVDQTLQELSTERTRLIIEEAAKTRGSKLGDFHASFVDEATIQARGLEPVEPIPGHHIQGALTLGENLADLAGLAVAYEAYHRSLGGEPAPVLGGTTGDQRFFLGHAQSRRSKHREPALRARLLSDAHAPARERVWTVRNLDSWYGAYQVEPGQKLYLAPEDRVRVW
ncbi:M13-type metalloendopeptidase [Cystobacter ferrugineus]|uniref:Peptidase M13 n=1 Tax=Cystobacter ferrugineus TaxID=83449 RepID=A0A1L9B3I2_9BACT|nr:M13 family metallopeptidase N-terminal domain-containing protein [Cystobacter ferrugineus]OJH36822.1 hypothetical protein BON30_30415 [Cystobacter ferrugineus]